jgi:hypothetical protein
LTAINANGSTATYVVTSVRSGLGIEALRATVQRFAEAEKLTIIAEFV